MLLGRIAWVVDKDALQSTKEKARWPLGEPFFWLKQHPVYAGLYLYHLKALFLEMGNVFIGAWGSVMYAGHLYNAVRQEKLLQSTWNDMELLFMLHENFFVGDRPSTSDDYEKRFLLSMGASASIFAKNKRNRHLEESKKGPKGLTELAPVTRLFKGRYCASGTRTDLPPVDLERILSKGMLEEKKKGSTEMSTAEGTELHAGTQSANPSMGKRNTTPSQFLRAFRSCLSAKAIEFSFDYFQMHIICWRLLRTVEQQCRSLLTKIFGPTYLERETELPFIVGYVFMAATQTNKVNMLVMKNKKENIVTSALLVEAAGALEQYIKDGVGATVSRQIGSTRDINVH